VLVTEKEIINTIMLSGFMLTDCEAKVAAIIKANTVFGCMPGMRPVIVPKNIPKKIENRISRNIMIIYRTKFLQLSMVDNQFFKGFVL